MLYESNNNLNRENYIKIHMRYSLNYAITGIKLSTYLQQTKLNIPHHFKISTTVLLSKNENQ